MKYLVIAFLIAACDPPSRENLQFKCQQIEGDLKIKRCTNGEVVCYGSNPLSHTCVGRKSVRKYF